MLIAPELSVFDTDDCFVGSDEQKGLVSVLTTLVGRGFRSLVHHPPSISANICASENFGRVAALLEERAKELGRPARVLVVGGQIVGEGARPLLDAAQFDVVETDVRVGPRTAIVCDGHSLPFANGSFEAVVCQAVLEHVVDPSCVAAEVYRVLAKDGLVYSEIPFMQQVHEGAFDFTRFTHLGHLRLWRYFEHIDSGATGGPGMALLWSLRCFIRSFFGRNRVMCALCERVVSLGLFWVKYFDYWLARKPGGIDGASGTYFLGLRRSTAVTDREILSHYRGLGPFA